MDVLDGPAVAVGDPGAVPRPECPVVAAGDDHVPGAGAVAVGEGDLPARRCPVEAEDAGVVVELGDEVAG